MPVRCGDLTHRARPVPSARETAHHSSEPDSGGHPLQRRLHPVCQGWILGSILSLLRRPYRWAAHYRYSGIYYELRRSTLALASTSKSSGRKSACLVADCGRMDLLEGAILRVSAEINQVSNAPGLDGDAYSCPDIWWNNGNRCLYFQYLATGFNLREFSNNCYAAATIRQTFPAALACR